MAKGIEIIIEIIDAITPENKSIDSQLYSALTRVRENLIVINQNKRYQKFGIENFVFDQVAFLLTS